jgi:hypothetical protein
MIIFFHAGVNASSAPNASGKLQAVCPKGIGNRLLGADLKFLSKLLQVSLFQLGNHPFLIFGCHFLKMFLQEILGLFLGARGEQRERSACRSGQGKIAEKLPSRIVSIPSISHRGFLSGDEVEARALRV